FFLTILAVFFFFPISFLFSTEKQSKEDTKFEFRYIRVLSEAPRSMAVTGSDTGTGTGTGIKSASKKTETIQLMGYNCEDVVVNSVSELLEEMRVTSEKDLSTEQAELLEAFKYSSSEKMKTRLKFGANCNVPDNKIIVNLCDTTFANCPDKGKLILKFWPCAVGNEILLSSLSGGCKDVLTHEVSHALDQNYRVDYGPDGMHRANEVTSEISAFAEGWAQFNEFYDFPESYFSVTSLTYEDASSTKDSPKYNSKLISSKDVKAQDLLKTENIVAGIMFKIASEIPDGYRKIYETFIEINKTDKSITSFLKKYLTLYSGDAAKVLEIFDINTSYKFPEEELEKLFPGHTRSYLSSRKTPKSGSGDNSANTQPSASIETSINTAIPSNTAIAIDSLENNTSYSTSVGTSIDSGNNLINTSDTAEANSTLFPQNDISPTDTAQTKDNESSQGFIGSW
ncbi:MAG: hypothetical protein HQM10_22790, partial [Candidatus Riflebacteria bacterium]|nr:hypothetical protein [Candidatus Riflebacteria bacterium]